MTTLFLKEFIVTGKLGPIYLGMKIHDLKQEIGEPSDYHDSGAGTALLFYNGFEFYYYTDTNTLYGIQNDNVKYEGALQPTENSVLLGDNITVDTWFIAFGKPISYKKVIEQLKKEEITFENVAKDNYDEIRFLSGVTFDFENWQDDEGQKLLDRSKAKLIGIRYFKMD